MKDKNIKDVLIESSGSALWYNEFTPPSTVPLEQQPQILIRCLNLQAIHTAMIAHTTRRTGKRERHLWQADPVFNANSREIRDVLGVLRACLGYHQLGSCAPVSRVSARMFFSMCRYLGVHPLSLFNSAFVEVWDPHTYAKYQLSVSGLRAPSAF